MAPKDVPKRRKQRDATEHGNVPIHRRRINWRRHGEKTKNEEDE